MLNKAISTPIAISIILVLAVAVGSFTWWQYGETWKEASELPEVELPEKEAFNSLNLETTKLVTIPDDYERTFSFHFDLKGRHVAYVGQKGEKSYLVFDGEESKEYDWVYDLFFSPDSEHFAYIARIGEEWILNVDDKEVKTHPSYKTGYASGYYSPIQDFSFSKDGKHFGYILIRPSGGPVIIVDGEEIIGLHPFDSFFFLSPDGTRFAYRTNMTSKWEIYDKNSVKYSYSKNGVKPIVNPEGDIIYITTDDNGWSLFSNGEKAREIGKRFEFERIKSFSISPNNEYLAYVYEESFIESGETRGEDKIYYRDLMVLGGLKSKPYNWISDSIFSPNSERFVYRAAFDDHEIVVLKKEDEDWKEDFLVSSELFLDEDIIGKIDEQIPVFSSDSKHLAYLLYDSSKLKPWFVALDDDLWISDGYDLVQEISFSPNGKYLAYGARKGNELWWIVEEVE